MLALPIFPGRLQPSIVGRSELNFRVRDGNGWTLALISTNYLCYPVSRKQSLLYRLFTPLSRTFYSRILAFKRKRLKAKAKSSGGNELSRPARKRTIRSLL